MKTYSLPFHIILLAFSFPALVVPLAGREELALSPNRLIQIEASLNRVQQGARTGTNEHYYFDYPRIHSDIATLRSGIENYLTPIRTQPQDAATLVGQYREEKTTS